MPVNRFDLPGVVVSGHPDRHVRRVVWNGELAYLKVEHRVPWRDRRENWLAGFGWSSKSAREKVLLDALAAAGLSAPRALACGEAGSRAFLLVEAVPDARDLLAALEDAGPARRRALARAVGGYLGRLHAAGFAHPDTDGRHFLVTGQGPPRVVLLDWQRGRRGPVSERDAVRALARLDATTRIAAGRERLACLRAYLRAARRPVGASVVRRWAKAVAAESGRLVRRGRRLNSRPGPTQELIWLAGDESLCARPDFADTVTPAGLEALAYGPSPALPRPLALARRRAWPWLGRLVAWVRGKAWRSPEVRQAGVLFQRERRGLPTPRLLAFGQRHGPWGRVDSFLLTETSEACVG